MAAKHSKEAAEACGEEEEDEEKDQQDEGKVEESHTPAVFARLYEHAQNLKLKQKLRQSAAEHVCKLMSKQATSRRANTDSAEMIS